MDGDLTSGKIEEQIWIPFQTTGCLLYSSRLKGCIPTSISQLERIIPEGQVGQQSQCLGALPYGFGFS
jgi:hypothetical protein